MAKDYVDELSQPRCKIFNRSFEEGCVSEDLKIAKVIPVFKNEDRKVVYNYRSISVLPACSKIIEKLLYNTLITFLNK